SEPLVPRGFLIRPGILPYAVAQGISDAAALRIAAHCRMAWTRMPLAARLAMLERKPKRGHQGPGPLIGLATSLTSPAGDWLRGGCSEAGTVILRAHSGCQYAA